MTADQRALVDHVLRAAPFDLGGPVETNRPLLEQMLTSQPLAEDVSTSSGELGGVPVVFVDIAGVQPRGTIFHIHGGGFALGSAAGAVGLVSDLARRTGMRAVSIDYRLAPESPFPAGRDDVIAAYQALLEQVPAGQVIVSGESAGGNLAAELLISARGCGIDLPAAGVLMSPMTDLPITAATFTTKAMVDPNITAEALRTRAAEYLEGVDPSDPRVSPVHADLTGLPPLLIQAGSHEVLLDDAISFAAAASAADVAVILDVTPDVGHVFQAFAAILDEGAVALDRAAAFVLESLGDGPAQH